MAQITNADVFEFMGTASDIQTQHGTLVTNLIARTITEVEQTIGRKIEDETITDELFEDGRNCIILDDLLFLKGKYRDLHTITSLAEDGTVLTPVSDSNDSGEYYLNIGIGAIKRVYGNWSPVHNAVKISGTLGLTDSTGFTNFALKQALIEIVAVKSGLWTSYYKGEEFTVKDITDPTKRLLESYTLKDTI